MCSVRWPIMLTLSVSFKARRCNRLGVTLRGRLGAQLSLAVPRSRAAGQSRWLLAQVRGKAGGEPSPRCAGEVTAPLADARIWKCTVSPFWTGALALESGRLCLGLHRSSLLRSEQAGAGQRWTAGQAGARIAAPATVQRLSPRAEKGRAGRVPAAPRRQASARSCRTEMVCQGSPAEPVFFPCPNQHAPGPTPGVASGDAEGTALHKHACVSGTDSAARFVVAPGLGVSSRDLQALQEDKTHKRKL